MDSEDDGFNTSDAEIDSEVEDAEAEQELGSWLDRLSAQPSVSNGSKKTPLKQSNYSALTPKDVMDSFRTTVFDTNGSHDVDFDEILGELKNLETQLHQQQSELFGSTSHLAPPVTSPSPSPSRYNLQRDKSKQFSNETISALSVLAPPSSRQSKTTTTPSSCQSQMATPSSCQSTGWDSDLDQQLQFALSELGNFFTKSSTVDSTSKISVTPVKNHVRFKDSTDQAANVTCPTVTTKSPDTLVSAMRKGHKGQRSKVQSNGDSKTLLQDSNPVQDPDLVTPLGDPNNPEMDSAFSDNVSLPSSGSHGSVTTTTSGSSSSGIGATTNNTTSGKTAKEEDVKMKAEKVRIALEKIKEASIKKLFVRAYSPDGSSKSILVDEKMSVAEVCDLLVVKNHAEPSVHWSIVEILPDLFMERLFEDDESLVENLLLWPRETSNRILFTQRHDKYQIFIQPQDYLQEQQRGCSLEIEAAKQTLVQEYFSESNFRIPDTSGMLYLKADGRKSWKRYNFVLRASGLYYNPKGKGKCSKDLVCLQKLDFVEIYAGIDWRRKYKAPSNFCFALKHPQLQKKSSKYIKYLCTDDEDSFKRWIIGIRIAKNGRQMLVNYENAMESVLTWNSRDIIPSHNFTNYLAKQHQLSAQFSPIRKANNPESTGCDKLESGKSSQDDVSTEEEVPRKAPPLSPNGEEAESRVVEQGVRVKVENEAAEEKIVTRLGSEILNGESEDDQILAVEIWSPVKFEKSRFKVEPSSITGAERGKLGAGSDELPKERRFLTKTKSLTAMERKLSLPNNYIKAMSAQRKEEREKIGKGSGVVERKQRGSKSSERYQAKREVVDLQPTRIPDLSDLSDEERLSSINTRSEICTKESSTFSPQTEALCHTTSCGGVTACHRRVSSGPSLTDADVILRRDKKPVPPPVPLRNSTTRLSFRGDSACEQTKTLISDLGQAISRKQPPPTNNKVDGVNSATIASEDEQQLAAASFNSSLAMWQNMPKQQNTLPNQQNMPTQQHSLKSPTTPERKTSFSSQPVQQQQQRVLSPVLPDKKQPNVAFPFPQSPPSPSKTTCKPPPPVPPHKPAFYQQQQMLLQQQSQQQKVQQQGSEVHRKPPLPHHHQHQYQQESSTEFNHHHHHHKPSPTHHFDKSRPESPDTIRKLPTANHCQAQQQAVANHCQAVPVNAKSLSANEIHFPANTFAQQSPKRTIALQQCGNSFVAQQQSPVKTVSSQQSSVTVLSSQQQFAVASKKPVPPPKKVRDSS